MYDRSLFFKKIILAICLFLLTAPFIQKSFNVIKMEPLNGAITIPERKIFYIKEWFSGTFQEETEKYLNETFGFRNFFIRLNNQISFFLFSKVHANSVIIGKKDYLYEIGYINTYNGEDFIGNDSTLHRFEKLKSIQDTLKSIKKTFILVFAAGKASFYPEYFPDKYVIKKHGLTNYKAHLEYAKKLGINYIDFNSYFLKLKSKSKYPLYPQYGIHWSNYGSFIACDSIIRYIEHIRKIDMANFFTNKIEFRHP